MNRNSSIAIVGVLLLLSGLASTATAQITVTMSPVTAIVISPLTPPDQRFDNCPGTFGDPMNPDQIPLEWELSFQNEGTAPVTVSYDDDVTDGLNGNLFDLVCPETLLPTGAVVTTCDPLTGRFTVDNIVIPACGRVLLRFQTVLNDPMASGRMDICNGGDVIDGASVTRTVTTLSNQVPMPAANPDDTCVFINPVCALQDSQAIELYHTIVDLNGPPLLPGDIIRVSTELDLTYMDLVPEFTFVAFYENTDPTQNPAALPPHIDFLQWITTPLAPDAEYLYDPATRILSIEDPDPANPPEILIAGLQIQQLGEWEGQINCAVVAGEPQCMAGYLIHGFGQFPTSDPFTRAIEDDTCGTAVQPDFSTSTKEVVDDDLGGDAQPGETLTFTVTVRNSTACPDILMDCECQATNILVTDVPDLSLLENIVPLDGGSFDGSTITWMAAQMGSAGRPNDVLTFSFEADVVTTAGNGDRICNDAEVTAAELLAIADGGVLENCASFAPTVMSVTPCMDVRNRPTFKLDVVKDPVPAVGPYPVGSSVTFNLTVTNEGNTDATNVETWDCIDPNFTVTNPGTGTPMVGGRCPGDWLLWTEPLLLVNDTRNYSFDVDISRALTAPTTNIFNTGEANSFERPTVDASPQVTIDACAPQLEFLKTVPPGPYGESSTITWTIQVTNTSPVACPATTIQMTDSVDLTILQDAPILTWSTTGASSSYTSPVITWDLTNPLLQGETISFTVSSMPQAGTSPTTVCNTADMTWFESLTPRASTPGAGLDCADILDGCAAVPAITPILGTKQPTIADVRFEWQNFPAATDGYRMCWIDSFAARGGITTTCGGANVVPGCDPTVTDFCEHLGAAPAVGIVSYYQVKGVCQGVEGP